MTELPLWPPILALCLGLVGYAILWSMRRRLDRDEEAARQKRQPAE